MNGFEKDANNESVETNSSSFMISLVGSLYPAQDTEFMSRGLSDFIKKSQPRDIVIRFVGIKSRTAVKIRIENYIDTKFLFFTNRVSKEQALEYMHTSNILLQVGSKRYKGYCPGKVLEYLAAKRNILIAPGDGDLTDRVIKETNSGVSVNTVEEMVEYLVSKYNEWKTNGCNIYGGNINEIEKYSRERQNQKLINSLSLVWEKSGRQTLRIR